MWFVNRSLSGFKCFPPSVRIASPQVTFHSRVWMQVSGWGIHLWWEMWRAGHLIDIFGNFTLKRPHEWSRSRRSRTWRPSGNEGNECPEDGGMGPQAWKGSERRQMARSPMEHLTGFTQAAKKHTKGFSDALGEKTLLFHRNAKDLQFGGRNSGLFPNPVLFPWNEKNEMPAFTCLGSWVSTNQKQAAHKVLLKLELCLVPKIHLDEETFKEVWSLSNYLIMFSWNKHIS